jgi:hypothetical protein
MEVNTYLAARTDNSKTDDVPTVWIGVTREEARSSCDTVECRLRPWREGRKKGDVMCYAWGGTPTMGLASIERSLESGTLNLDAEEMIKKRAASARFVRIGALGDPAVKPWGWWYSIRRLAKKHGLKTIAYTHGWDKRPDLIGMTMASCDSIEEGMEAKAMGFQVAIATRDVKPTDKSVKLPDGSTGYVCPAIYTKAVGKPQVQCNQCLKCTGEKPDLTIIFPDHGPGSPYRKRRKASAFKCR